jgi:hypothetical protein
VRCTIQVCTLINTSTVRIVIIAIDNIVKPNKFQIFGSKKTKGPKLNSQNQLRSPMPEGGLPLF